MAINVFTASGNIGKDCEIRVTPNGKSIGTFSLPVKSGWGDNEKTSWVTCKIFGKQAEAIGQYLTKGSKVTVTGEFVQESWTDQQGQEKSINCILVRDVELPPKTGQTTSQQQQGYNQPSRQDMNNEYHRNDQQSAGGEPTPDFDDDILFAPIGLQYANHVINVI